MKFFAKRVYGFDPTRWPTISFSLAANRDLLLQQSEIGDYIVFVGTQDDPTAEEDRGRILGSARIGRTPVNTLDLIAAPDEKPRYDFNDDGSFRWPYAVAMTKAWAFPAKPRLLDVIARQLPMNAISQAVLLNDEDSSAIQALVGVEIEIPNSATIERLRTLEAALTRGQPTTGVPPVAWSRTVTHTIGNASVTYVMRYGNTDCWKIGHATNERLRLAEVNKHIPIEITGTNWNLCLIQRWQNEEQAYAMEQRLLGILTERRSQGERVICSEAQLNDAWFRAVGA